MRTLETERLSLRAFTEKDFAAVHRFASNFENTIYVILMGPNTEEQTQAFINMAIQKSKENPLTDYHYAVVQKETQQVIGACQISVSGCEASLGWILHRDHWKQGYGTELGLELLRFGFEELNLHRITAECDAENQGSCRLMEKIGMRREGCFIQSRQANKLSDQKYGDALTYAILAEEWEMLKEIAYYKSLPCTFDDFIEVPELSDGVIYLVCIAKEPAIPEKKYVPAYVFAICLGGEKIGEISLRIGYPEGLYYGGQIGYMIDEKHRGHGYAGRACRLLGPVAKAHDMQKLLITNNHTNHASKRVCEKLGAKLIRVARLPEWTELYQEGQRFENIFEWLVE